MSTWIAELCYSEPVYPNSPLKLWSEFLISCTFLTPAIWWPYQFYQIFRISSQVIIGVIMHSLTLRLYSQRQDSYLPNLNLLMPMRLEWNQEQLFCLLKTKYLFSKPRGKICYSENKYFRTVKYWTLNDLKSFMFF